MSFVRACSTEEELLTVLGSVTNRDLRHSFQCSVCIGNCLTANPTCRYVIEALFADLQEVSYARCEVCNGVITLGRRKVEDFRLQNRNSEAADRRKEDITIDTCNGTGSTDCIPACVDADVADRLAQYTGDL